MEAALAEVAGAMKILVALPNQHLLVKTGSAGELGRGGKRDDRAIALRLNVCHGNEVPFLAGSPRARTLEEGRVTA
jgi:hypothetical protein